MTTSTDTGQRTGEAHLRGAFAAAGADGRTAIVGYLMCGHPTIDETPLLVEAMVRGGADVVELGMPFSDPLADGPTIQRAATAALGQGVTVAACIEHVRAARALVDVPLVLMGYCNPVLAYGTERFCADASAAGASGVILADLPPEEAGELLDAARTHGLGVVFLVTPVTSSERIAEVSALGSGFLYCVARTGSTGAGSELGEEVAAFLDRARDCTDLPTAVGFGISTPAHVAALAPHADGVVIGSALLDLLDRVPANERAIALEAMVAGLVRAASARP